MPAGVGAWWKGESNALDSVGIDAGILENGAGFTSGEVGRAFNFNGADQFVLVRAQDAALDIGQGSGFTIEGWIQPTTLGQPSPICEYEQVLGSAPYYPSVLGVQFYVSAQSPGNVFANIVDTGVGQHELQTGSGFVTTNVWQHIALTYDKVSGEAIIYVDAAPILAANIGTFTPQTSFTNFLIGGRTYGGSVVSPSDKFPGALDEITIYDRALTSNEITAIYDAGGDGKCPLACDPAPTNTVAWYPGESDTDDIIGHNNGVLPNGGSYTNGEVGWAFYFDGISQYLLVQATNSALDIGAGGGFTIETWINPSTLTPVGVITEYERQLATRSGLDVGLDYSINNDTTNLVPGAISANIVDTSDVSHPISSLGNVLTTNEWQHVALTYDKSSGTGRLWVDGAVVAQNNLGTFTPQTTFTNILTARTTFNSVTSPNAPFPGGIDELTFYNRALTTNEIEAIYNSGIAGKCR